MTELKPTFKPICGTCVFYSGIKEKHGAEGVCIFNPPAVFPLMGRDLANRPTLQWLSAPQPSVKETSVCGHWQGNVPAVETKALEN